MIIMYFSKILGILIKKTEKRDRMNNILKFLNKMVTGLLFILLQIIWFYLLLKNMTNYWAFLWLFTMAVSFCFLLFIMNQKLIPETKIYWLILILLFPIFGILSYILYHSSPSFINLKKRIKSGEEQAAKYKEDNIIQKLTNEPKNIYSQINFFNHNNFSIYENCEVKYYSYASDVYKDMLKALKQAKKFIFLEYFIISESAMWIEVLDILKEKAKNRVEVRVLYDDIGSAFHLKKNYISSLADSQIKMMSFFPKTLFPATDNRNHRKSLIIDGEVVFTGGMNIADECIKKTKKYDVWKDSSIMIKGSAVFEFTKTFLTMWNANINIKSKINIKFDEKFDKYRAKSKQYSKPGYIIPYHHNPFNQERVASRVYLNIINQATNYLYIFTPYLILDYSMKEALLLASKRGVEIKIITPGIPDKKLVYQVTRSYYKELLISGIKIYEYTPGFLHAKCFLSDDEIATVGAVNLDYRSLYTHFENGCYFYQGEIINTMKQDFIETLKSSREITTSDLSTNFFKTIWETILNLFSPLL